MSITEIYAGKTELVDLVNYVLAMQRQYKNSTHWRGKLKYVFIDVTLWNTILNNTADNLIGSYILYDHEKQPKVTFLGFQLYELFDSPEKTIILA